MKWLGQLWNEFKAFAFQGNMIELAVAVVIGGAFGGVIHSLVGDVIMPTVAFIIHEGETAAQSAKDAAVSVASKAGLPTSNPTTAPSTDTTAATGTTPPAAPVVAAAPAAAPAPAAKPDDTKPISIDFSIGPVPVGKFLTELINFIILAFAVFIMIVKLVGGAMKRMKKKEAAAPPTTKECPECLSTIPILAKRCAHCTAVLTPPATT